MSASALEGHIVDRLTIGTQDRGEGYWSHVAVQLCVLICAQFGIVRANATYGTRTSLAHFLGCG